MNNYCSEINITEKFIKHYKNCFRAYIAHFDFEELYKAMNDIGFKIKNPFTVYCDVCRKDLNNAQSFKPY